MSPRGFTGVRQASAEIESRRGAGGPSALWFRLKSGEETVVRFLEEGEDIFWAMMHDIPVEGRSFGRDVVCLDQNQEGTPCPGCERDLPRRFKGFINLIWHDAPVFKRDGDGRLEKDNSGQTIITTHKPQVAVWGSGIRVFEELDEVNANYRGLKSRPFRVKRKGDGLSTKYTINPAEVDGGPTEMTAEEKKLQTEKYDLNQFTKPLSYDLFLRELGETPRNGGGSGEQKQQRANPFMRS